MHMNDGLLISLLFAFYTVENRFGGFGVLAAVLVNLVVCFILAQKRDNILFFLFCLCTCIFIIFKRCLQVTTKLFDTSSVWDDTLNQKISYLLAKQQCTANIQYIMLSVAKVLVQSMCSQCQTNTNTFLWHQSYCSSV